MANQKISTLAPATAPLVGSELMELVQGGVNVKAPLSTVLQTAAYSASAPAAGIYTDIALPGPGNYMLDYDTSLGDIEIDGVIAQRDGQIVTFGNNGIGGNRLKLGVNVGTAANQLRGNAGPLDILQGDTLTIKYVQAILRWILI